MMNHSSHDSLLQRFNCEISNIETYSCKDCNFKTELTLSFKHHVQEHHGVRKIQASLSVYTMQNYICEKCSFETHFIMKWLQHSTKCSNNEDNSETITDTKRKYKHKNYVQTHIISKQFKIKWHKCQVCPYKAKK